MSFLKLKSLPGALGGLCFVIVTFPEYPYIYGLMLVGLRSTLSGLSIY